MLKRILGTRGSRLALAQSTLIADALRAAHPGLEVELRVITTRGDRILDVALSAVGDKGLFVKELEQALLAEEVDFCVHSCKDLPSIVP
ncbi:MAG: hydroxymethylbilane synthase, partial [Chloroflexaceae bacterium]